MYAKDMDEEKADEYLDDLLAKIAAKRAESGDTGQVEVDDFEEVEV